MASLTLASVTVNTGATIDLTALGVDDYAVWDQTSASGIPAIRKNSGGSTISATSGAFDSGYLGDPNTYSGTDGTPTSIFSKSEGVYKSIFVDGTGISSTVPANTVEREARFYGSYYATGAVPGPTITGHLSDSSASDVSNSATLPASNGSVVCFVAIFIYSAGSAGQTLTISQLAGIGSGGGINIDWNAVTVKTTAVIPILSAPSVFAITSSQVRPRVTITF